MKIADQTVVTMTYILREKDENGKLIQETTKEQPFTCIFGMKQLLPKFEENLMGKEPGDTFKFYLTPEEGYGKSNADLIMDLDKNIFCNDGRFMEDLVKVGAQLTMQDNYGNPVPGVVKAIGDSTVTMDFNSPLADTALCFSGEILDVRETNDDDFKDSCDDGCGCDSCHCEGNCGDGSCH